MMAIVTLPDALFESGNLLGSTGAAVGDAAAAPDPPGVGVATTITVSTTVSLPPHAATTAVTAITDSSINSFIDLRFWNIFRPLPSYQLYKSHNYGFHSESCGEFRAKYRLVRVKCKHKLYGEQCWWSGVMFQFQNPLGSSGIYERLPLSRPC